MCRMLILGPSNRGFGTSTSFKLDLLSASKYGTPATGVRCNDDQGCWIPSNDVTRKVTEDFCSSYGVMPNEHKPKIAHTEYSGFAIQYFIYINQQLIRISIPQTLQIYSPVPQASEGMRFFLGGRNRFSPYQLNLQRIGIRTPSRVLKGRSGPLDPADALRLTAGYSRLEFVLILP